MGVVAREVQSLSDFLKNGEKIEKKIHNCCYCCCYYYYYYYHYPDLPRQREASTTRTHSRLCSTREALVDQTSTSARAPKTTAAVSP